MFPFPFKLSFLIDTLLFFKIAGNHTKLEEMIKELSGALRTVKHEQDYMNLRERVHRTINESTVSISLLTIQFLINFNNEINDFTELSRRHVVILWSFCFAHYDCRTGVLPQKVSIYFSTMNSTTNINSLGFSVQILWSSSSCLKSQSTPSHFCKQLLSSSPPIKSCDLWRNIKKYNEEKTRSSQSLCIYLNR